MFIKPEGAQLSEAQARELDDEYLAARPLGYFNARLAQLVAGAHQESALSDVNRTKFREKLGLSFAPSFLEVEDSDRTLQLAVDAFALRHHAAEALVRLYHAVSVAKPREGAAECLWLAVCDSPRSDTELTKSVRKAISVDSASGRFYELLIPRTLRPQGAATENLGIAVQNSGEWLERAIELLEPGELNVNVAHNKVKHGLAFRARDDIRSSIVALQPGDGHSIIEADSGGQPTVRLSVLTGEGSAEVFTNPLVSFLSRPPKLNKLEQPLELTSLDLDTEALLAEAFFIATIYGAIFHTAAVEHFGGREVEIAKFPTLPVGPSPKQLLNERPVGLREPLTSPVDEQAFLRPMGIGGHGWFQKINIDHDSRVTAVISEG
ncbi:MAG: hypothetical protein ACSHW9_02005 [Salinibacterium amurskyense]